MTPLSLIDLAGSAEFLVQDLVLRALLTSHLCVVVVSFCCLS